MYSRTWQLISILLAVLALALLIAALAMPMWIYMDDEDDHVGVGLFYRIGLDPDDGDVLPALFAKVRIMDDDTLDADHWKAMIAMEMMSTIACGCLILFILFHYLIAPYKEREPMGSLYPILLWTSVLCWVLNMIALFIFMIYHGDALTEAHNVSDRSFPWAPFISAFALFINLAITAIIFTKFNTSGGVIPGGADPRMAALPSSQTGMFNRYYQTEHNNALSPPPLGPPPAMMGQNLGMSRSGKIPPPPAPIIDNTRYSTHAASFRLDDDAEYFNLRRSKNLGMSDERRYRQ